MTLIELIKNGLKTDDKKIVECIDINKTNDEIIADMIKAGLLKLDKDNYNDQKISKNK